ncbi:MAG: conserved phage C-terminal domain-containing protein, partial [Gordonibacter sp.]|uniref:conserved phage C-terminal domain-containing protein n=1 Tax=Gordonibacter sp. TaxID=1968902 RepID=UPI002FCA7C0C
FMVAVVRYGMTGAEPKGSPLWLPTFTVLKKRIRLSSARATSGSKGGKSTKANKEANNDLPSTDQPSKPEANDGFASQSNGKQNEILPSCVEGEGEKEVEVELSPSSPPFGLLCLNELNEVLGTCYGTLPSKAALCLSRMDGKYELSDVRRMIEYKRDEWTGTRFANNLTPNTLFGPDHFEQYMHQSKTSAKEASEYDIYDD